MVSIAQQSLLGLLPVEQHHRARLSAENESLSATKLKAQVPIPDAVIRRLKPHTDTTSQHKRKMADNDVVARLLAGKNLQLDHKLRGTEI